MFIDSIAASSMLFLPPPQATVTIGASDSADLKLENADGKPFYDTITSFSNTK